MKRFEIAFRPDAVADLMSLHDYIAEQAGLAVVGGYIERIEAACLALEIFPHRGTRRDDIRKGLRTIGFEGRATIVFHVGRAKVRIVRIFYGGQDYEHLLKGR